MMGRRAASPESAVVCLLVALALPACLRAQAGPPFLSNDPGTPGNGNWEINVAGAQSVGHGMTIYQVPQIDLNLGLGDRIQLTYQIPYIVGTQAGRPHRSGWSNAFTGIKWRFLDQGEGGWQASIFPQVETNGLASARQKDIAVAGPRWLLPLEVTRRMGPLDVDFEAGYYLREQGTRERILGLVVGRPLSQHFDLAVELYDDRAIGAPVDERTLDLGGRFELSRGLIALFMAGHGVGGSVGGSGFIGYFGIQILVSDHRRSLERQETPIATAAH